MEKYKQEEIVREYIHVDLRSEIVRTMLLFSENGICISFRTASRILAKKINQKLYKREEGVSQII